MKYIDIYECVIKHYPLGISELEPIYQEYSGYKRLRELCDNKFSSIKSDNWEEIKLNLNSSFSSNTLISDNTEVWEPCYSCSYILFENQISNIRYRKEVRIHISVLGPFYTVYGLDTVQIFEANNIIMQTQPILTISPIDDYRDSIPLVRVTIEKIQSELNYTPFYYLKKRVKALSVAGAQTIERIDASIFQALFINEDVTNYRYKGDINYCIK